METITVLIGKVEHAGDVTNDYTNEVTFEGEALGYVTEYGPDRGGAGITDTRGVTQTLYRTDTGKLIVHVEDWSRWQGEPTTYSLHEVAEDALRPNGRFERLGRKAGFGRPLTLDEALSDES